jgi:hypothetical protein
LARLCLDHNVSHDLCPLLGRAGHDAITVRDISGERLHDDVLFLTTVRLNRVFITHNRKDFRLLHDAWVTWPVAFAMALPPHPGILVLDAAPHQILAGVIGSFLERTPIERLVSTIFWWRRHGGWDRSIDGGPWEPYQSSGASGQE